MNHIVWKKLNQVEKMRGRIFRYEVHDFESPISGKKGAFDVIKVASWVNVIALTSDDKMIMVKQFRAGTAQMTLEIPGGAIDQGEAPMMAAKRELEEETGFLSDNWIELGWVHPNPAFLTNKCWTFLANDCQPCGKMNLDPLEEIEVELFSHEEVDSKVSGGEISHGLILNAFYFYRRFLDSQNRA